MSIPSPHQNSTGSSNAISWTTDPSLGQDCFTDWIIQVVCHGGHNDQVYYVHKVVLAVGPRHSEYFARLFKQCSNTNSTMLREQQDNVTRFQSLSEEEAGAMPMLLDFIYGKNDFCGGVDQQLDESFLIGLHKLGQYLLVPTQSLFKAVAEVCQDRHSLESLLGLTSELRTVVDDIEPFHEVSASVILKCAESVDLPLAAKIHPDLLIRAIRMATENNESKPFRADCILASMEHHRESLTKESFDFLGCVICETQSIIRKHQRTAAGKKAMRLLLLSVDLIDEHSSSELTRVQKSCINAITFPQAVYSSGPTGTEGARDILSRFPKNMLVEIVIKSAARHHGGVLLAALADIEGQDIF